MRLPLLVCASMLLLNPSADNAAAGGVQRAEDIFRGAWLVESAECRGKPDKACLGETFNFNGNVVTITTKSGQARKGLFKVDPSRKPQTFDLLVTEGGKERYYGVYDFSGTRVRLLYAATPADRPTELRTEPARSWILINLVRVHD